MTNVAEIACYRRTGDGNITYVSSNLFEKEDGMFIPMGSPSFAVGPFFCGNIAESSLERWIYDEDEAADMGTSVEYFYAEVKSGVKPSIK